MLFVMERTVGEIGERDVKGKGRGRAGGKGERKVEG